MARFQLRCLRKLWLFCFQDSILAAFVLDVVKNYTQRMIPMFELSMVQGEDRSKRPADGSKPWRDLRCQGCTALKWISIASNVAASAGRLCYSRINSESQLG